MAREVRMSVATVPSDANRVTFTTKGKDARAVRVQTYLDAHGRIVVEVEGYGLSQGDVPPLSPIVVKCGSDREGDAAAIVYNRGRFQANAVAERKYEPAYGQEPTDGAELAPSVTKGTLHIEGRRWFEKRNGNTYHSVTIFKAGAVIARLPFQYGYGDQYLQTALDWLKANGHAPADAEYGTRYLREVLGATYTVSDVARKSDL